MRFDLSDEEWAVIEPLFPLRVRGPERIDDRYILNGIFNILRMGAPWRDLPERYGPRPTAYNRYAVGLDAGFGAIYSRHWPKLAKTVACHRCLHS